MTQSTNKTSSAQAVKKQRLAIIGTGISGLGLASIVRDYYDICIYEKEDRVGGHSRTIEVEVEQNEQGDIEKTKVPVDTGFIVFNKRTYPLLTKLFMHLDVPLVKSKMTFGATIADGWLEYSTHIPRGFWAQKRNLLRPKFWRFIYDLLTFDKRSKPYLKANKDKTLAQCLDELPLGSWFKEYFVFAMGGAIWSMPTRKIKAFPASSFLRFFDNHSLLTISGRPQWYTVEGGSQVYVERLAEPIMDKVHLNAGVSKVERKPDGVWITDETGKVERFDQVAFACHSNQALSMIQQPSTGEQAILGDLTYGRNKAITHHDEAFMPKRKGAWASWIFQSERRSDAGVKQGSQDDQYISLSYWMNNLQCLKTQSPVFVSLNPGRTPQPSKVFDEKYFEHPQFDEAAMQAQTRIDDIQGKDRLWFCGAYCGYGFHEDGLRSAVHLAGLLGCKPEWL